MQGHRGLLPQLPLAGSPEPRTAPEEPERLRDIPTHVAASHAWFRPAPVSSFSVLTPQLPPSIIPTCSDASSTSETSASTSAPFTASSHASSSPSSSDRPPPTIPDQPAASSWPRALHLFSGPKGRPDGLAAHLSRLGFSVVEVDSRGVADDPDDLLNDDVYSRILADAVDGTYQATVIGIPCSTYSVARFRSMHDGPPVVRRRGGEERGLHEPPPGHEHEAARANLLVQRAVAIAQAVHDSGGVYVIENPIDRGDPLLAARINAAHGRATKVLRPVPEHASLWQMVEISQLAEATHAELVHFPQCMLGGRAQKLTTFLFSPALTGLRSLGQLVCHHSKEQHGYRFRAKRRRGGGWGTASLAAYPATLNQLLATSIAEALHRQVAPQPRPRKCVRWGRVTAYDQQGVEVTHDLPPASQTSDAAADPSASQQRPAQQEQPPPREQLPFNIGERVVLQDSTPRSPATAVIAHMHLQDGEYSYTVLMPDGSQYSAAAQHLTSLSPLVGSKRPHASLAEATLPQAKLQASRLHSASLRRNEPELASTLQREPLPATNVAPDTEWFDPPADTSPPGPLSTDQLIPEQVQRRLREHRRKVQEVYKRANGPEGWRYAKGLRPDPLHFSEEEALLPAGRGWSWHRRPDGLWYPLTRSRWPEDPPESDLDVPAILRAAQADPATFGTSDKRFSDRYILASMAHGYEAPDLERATVIAYPHVGALKEMSGLRKCILKDRKQDEDPLRLPWQQHGSDLPEVWPMRADPVNVVMRNGKARMTIDKSIQLVARFVSYNDAVSLPTYDPVEMVRVGQLSRSIAILLTAGVGVRIWSFDLEAYFRRTGKQRADWWKSGLLLPDGYAFDKRIQFGQKEAPNLTSRQSNFLTWAIRRQLWLFDRRYPPTDPTLLAWRLLRSVLAQTEASDSPQCLVSVLSFIMTYVDDVGAASVDDLLFEQDGTPVYGAWCATREAFEPCGVDHPSAVHIRRPDAHYWTALRTIESFGHTSAEGKGVSPRLQMDLLGVHIDVAAQQQRLTELKARTYGDAASGVLSSPAMASGSLKVDYNTFNSLVHKLLHASSTVVLGRQHLHHCLAARHVDNRLRGNAVILHHAQRTELEWWLLQFQDPTRHCLPLASRCVFPLAGDEGTVVAYSDAAREIAQPSTSGFGAWTVLDDTFYYLHGLWSIFELNTYSINVLELAAESMGTFAFIAQAKALGRRVSHSIDFVDNTAAEYSADRGKPSSARMRSLVQQRFDALDTAHVFSAVDRITSKDNEWADALSRGDQRAADVVRFARAAGLSVHRLYPTAQWRDLSHLASLQ